MKWHNRKNTIITEPGNLNFWLNFWKSKEINKIFNENEDYYNLLKQASLVPWMFVDEKFNYERRHFSIWFGHTFLRRKYDNPIIEDLYYLHDLLHGVNFHNAVNRKDIDDLTNVDVNSVNLTAAFYKMSVYEKWVKLMRSNEIGVSLETEFLIYCRFPWLREKTFNEKIWFDKFKNDNFFELKRKSDCFIDVFYYHQNDEIQVASEKELRSLIPEDGYVPFKNEVFSFDELWNVRRLVSLMPNQNCFIEKTIASYENGSKKFYNCWETESFFLLVEKYRKNFRTFVEMKNFDAAEKLRIDFFDETCDNNGVPFGKVAEQIILSI